MQNNNDLEIYNKLGELSELPASNFFLGEDSERERKIAEHKLWLRSIRHERPNPTVNYKIGVYIRYFNQTRYENYLSYHKRQFEDTIGLCPNWTLVDFYIDGGATPPKMENAKDWSRLIQDCIEGKIDLIITQKISNVSKDPKEITILSRLLAAQEHPIGIYFVSEDIFTLASYYQSDLRDMYFFPDNKRPNLNYNENALLGSGDGND
ncbi:MAG: recombinase family protein [Clostridia bacterium]|nr:recombinase family protein [Clostridia bacterium]